MKSGGKPCLFFQNSKKSPSQKTKNAVSAPTKHITGNCLYLQVLFTLQKKY